MNRTGRGRPLRFVATVFLGWIAVRAIMFSWSSAPPWKPPPRAKADRATAGLSRRPLPRRQPVHPRVRLAATTHVLQRFADEAGSRRLSAPIRLLIRQDPLREHPPREEVQPDAATTPLSFPHLSHEITGPVSHRRWRASGWLVVRPGRGIGAAPAASQIGGSQFGVRLRYALDRADRLAAYGRIAGPVQGRGTETALGVEWQPTALPVRLTFEQRFGLDGMRGGPGIGVVAGTDRRLLGGMRLEGYGQAGMIVRAQVEPYADGALRVTVPAARRHDAHLAIGMGAWGAAQRETQRLDLGPSIVAGLPIGPVHARLILDWRQRVMGNARPGSGVALTLASDF